MAIEAVADLSLDEEVKTQFSLHPDYLNSLISLLDDKPVHTSKTI
jgi:hypothetical protein